MAHSGEAAGSGSSTNWSSFATSGAVCREGQFLATLAPPHGHNHFHSMFDHEHRKTPIIAAELGSAHLKPAHVAGLAPSLH